MYVRILGLILPELDYFQNPTAEAGPRMNKLTQTRGGSRTAATSKMEHFEIIVNGWKPLTIITKSSILDVAVVLDPPLQTVITQEIFGEMFCYFTQF